MKYIGLDLSLANTGIAEAWRNPHQSRGFSLNVASVRSQPTDNIDGRLSWICMEVEGHLPPAFDEALYVLEGLAVSRNNPSAQERAALHFMMRAQLIAKGRRFIVVGPTMLKKFICGTGAAKKELMLKEIFRRYGVDTDDNNKADAAALAIFGLAHDGHIAMTAQQADMMRSFQLPKVKKAKKVKA